jgi:non-specific serine/threonine protein kinase
MATTYKGDIVVLGGWVPAPPQQSSGYGYGGSGAPSRTTIFSNRVFALRQGKWVELPQLRDARAAGAAVVIGDRLIVVGGVNDNGLVATTEVYDGTAWTLGTDLPTPRDHLAAATDGHYLFAVGGHAGSADRPLATVERYDPDARVWQGMPDMPTPRGGLGAAFVSGKVVAVGGDSPSSALGAVEAFDVRGNAWSPLPPLGAPRHDAAVAALGQSLFAIDGGLDPGSGHPTPAGEVLRF